MFEEKISFLLLCSSLGHCHLSSVLNSGQPFELTVGSNLSPLAQMCLCSVQPLLQFLTCGRKLKDERKVFLTTPEGFVRPCLLMP